MYFRSLVTALIFACVPSVASTQIDPATLAKAKQGNAVAQYNLSVMYSKGDGVGINIVQAYIWFSAAGANGEAKGSKNKASLANRMGYKQTAMAELLAQRCLRSDYKKCVDNSTRRVPMPKRTEN